MIHSRLIDDSKGGDGSRIRLLREPLHHAALARGGWRGTSTILKSAFTRPVRPSSNFTCVSMYCEDLPD